MKNLKKVLALALAVIMMMSLFTVAFAAETETKLVASDFTDWNEVEYKDAVALAVDLGIINGISNGDGTYKFAPKDSIDRASWAKLIYFIATGDDDASAYKGANVGMTDISTSWAEGYIAYCVANNYAAGDGLGHFLPANTTTVSAGLKTLLTVLGYDADKQGYQGTTTWAANVMTDAKKLGLMDDVAKSNTALSTLTREVAAQIIYNALQAETVSTQDGRDNGEFYVEKYIYSGNTLGLENFNIVPVTAELNSVDGNGVGTFTITDRNGVTSPSLKGVKADPSLCGESVIAYVKVNPKTMAFIETVSTAAVKSPSTADYTFTNGVNVLDIFKKNTTNDTVKAHYVGIDTTTDGTFTITAYINGDSKTLQVDVSSGVATINSASDAYFKSATAVGDVVNVYTNSKGEVTMIKAIDYSVATLTKDVETRTTKDGDLQVRIGALSTGWVNAAKVSGWEDLKEDDVVLYYAGPNSTYVIEKAEKVTGSVTALKGTSELTINGEKYTQSGITGATSTLVSGWSVSGSKNNTYDFYLDKNGSLALSVLVEGEVETNVAFVLDSAWVTGSGIAGSNYAEAKLLFNDGTTEIVKIAKYSTDGTKGNMKKIVAGSDTSDAWGTGSSAGFEVTTGQTKLTKIDNKFVTYSVNSDGNYEVCLTANERKTDVSATNKYNTTAARAAAGAIKNEVKFDGTLVANNKTVFFVEKVDGDDTTYSIYTGYKNVPALTNVAAGEAIKDTNGVAAYVYLKTTTGFNGEKPNGYIYVADASDYIVNTDGNYVYNIYDAEGNEDTIVLNISVSAGFYPIKSVGEKYTTLDTVVSVTKTLAKLGNGLVEITSDTIPEFSYDEDTVFVVVDFLYGGTFDSCSSFSADSFEINTTDYTYKAVVVGVSASDNVADYVYVTRTANS